MKSNPRVLVAVPTYGRPQFLPRIIANFDRLQYANKKLVIINDDPRTKYSFNPDSFNQAWNNVNIINLENETPMPISKKRNLFLDWDWDIIFYLDDDDVFLPDRIDNHIKIYNKDPDIDVVKNTCFYITYGGALASCSGLCTMNFSITRDGVDKAGCFDENIIGSGEDTDWWDKIYNSCNIHYFEDLNLADYVYWFSGSNYHASNFLEGNNQEEIDHLSDHIKRYLSNNKYEKHINLLPDYESYDSVVTLCNKVASTNIEAPYTWLNDKCTGIVEVVHEGGEKLDLDEILAVSKLSYSAPVDQEFGVSQINESIHAQQHPGTYYALNQFFSQNKFDCLIEVGTGSGGLTEFLCASLPDVEVHSFDSYPSSGTYEKERFNEERFNNYSNLTFYNLDCFEEETIKKIRELTANKKTCWMFDGGNKNKEFNTFIKIAEKADFLMMHDFARNAQKYKEIYTEKKRWYWHESGFEDILDLEHAEWAEEDLLEQCLWGTYKKL